MWLSDKPEGMHRMEGAVFCGRRSGEAGRSDDEVAYCRSAQPPMAISSSAKRSGAPVDRKSGRSDGKRIEEQCPVNCSERHRL